jgi:hypothetical protein
MPGYDGTGPQGRGSMTGGRFGKCHPVYTGDSKQNFPSENTEKTMSTYNGFRYPAYNPNRDQVYGVGRGGVPCGCGRGFAYGRRGSRRGRELL